MNILERKTLAILGGRKMRRGDAQSEISLKFRLNRKEAREVIRDMKKRGLLYS